MFPGRYKILAETSWRSERYALVPIRYEDRLAIMQWRNEQLYHLRQQQPLTETDQERYFTQVVAQLFEQEQPHQLLFSYLEDENCIGYGGLVHINWNDRHAEISFVMETQREKQEFSLHWKTYLGLIEQVAFNTLQLRKIFTYAYDLRPHLFGAIEAAGYEQEAVLKDHCLFDGNYVDVLIHSKRHPFRLRNATMNDAQLLFDWANDPEVRRNSLNPEEIIWGAHLSWLKMRMNSEHSRIFILEKNGEPVGQIRIDLHTDRYEIDYSIAQEYRGKSFGKTIVSLLLKQLPGNRFLAVVKKGNVPSGSVFKRLGFTVQHENDELTTFVYDA